MTSSVDVAYGDAEPTEYQRGFIDGMEQAAEGQFVSLRLQALNAAVMSQKGRPLNDHITDAERIVKMATIFYRYLDTGE